MKLTYLLDFLYSYIRLYSLIITIMIEVESVAIYQNIPLNPSNTSKYFETCWIKIDPAINITASGLPDTSFVFSMSESYAAGIVNAIQSVIGVILNTLVIVALLRNSELRQQPLTPSIISISITDLLFSGFILSVTTIHWFLWDLPMSCQIWSFVLYGLWICSALNLLGIAIIRLLVAYNPREYKKMNRKKQFWILPLLGWFISVIWLLPTLFGVFGQFGFECRTLKCRFINVNNDNVVTSFGPDRAFPLFIILLGVVLLVLNIATYIKLKRESRKLYGGTMENKDKEAEKRINEREKKMERMVIVVTTSFFLVYIPMAILRNIDPDAMITKRKSFIFCYLCTCMIGIIDPLVYIIFQESYRNEIKDMFKSVACIKLRSNSHETKIVDS